MYWAEYADYRTAGPSPYPESQTALSPAGPIYGGSVNQDVWYNGGLWLMSVHRLSANNLLGFVHAEDHWFPPNPDGISWKSIAVANSNDDGVSWSSSSQIITSWRMKPDTPVWGGAGDFCVIRDATNQRWVCFFQEEGILCVAVSFDSYGAPGTWRKWDGVDFTIPGLGGRGQPLLAFQNHEGGNPSVSWNTYLGKWIMVYGGWDGNLYISSSANLVNWTDPQTLMTPIPGKLRVWYPTIIGTDGDQVCGLLAGQFLSSEATR